MAERINPPSRVAGPKAIGDTDPADTAQPHTPLPGDFHDDDGSVIDAFFEPHPNPELAAPFDVGYPMPTIPATLPTPTRLITRALTIGQPPALDRIITPIDPIQVFPLDVKRKFLRLRLSLPTIRTTLFSAAAAGANFSYTLTAPMKLEAIHARLVTDANVATRNVLLQIDTPAGTAGGTSHSFIFGPPAGQAASAGVEYLWANTGATSSNSYNNGLLPPDMDLPAGTVITLTAGSLQVGDVFSNVNISENTHLWRVAGDKSECFSAPDQVQEMVWESRDHTGPVWVYAPLSVGECQLIAESVSG